MAGLKPLCLEYLDDKFVAENIDKYYLCKMFFYGGAGRNGGINLSTMKVINFNDSQGKRIGGLETVGGNSLENFHHKLSSDLN